MRMILFAMLSALGLLVGASVHVASYMGFLLPASLKWVGVVLHVGAIALLGAFVMQSAIGGRRHQRFFARMLSIKGPNATPLNKILIPLFLVYTFANFTLNAGAGTFQVKDGKYVETMRGRVMNTFPTKEAFKRARLQGQLRTARAFSGHWVFFYGVILLISIGGVRRREEIEHFLDEEDQREADEQEAASLSLEQEGAIILSQAEIPTLAQRVMTYSPSRSLIFALGAQIVVIALVGVGVTIVLGPEAVGFFLFLVGFLTFGLIANLLSFRSLLKDYVTSVRFTQDECQIDYLEKDTPKKISLPYSEAGAALFVKVEAVRGGERVTFVVNEQRKPVLEQICDGPGVWTKGRCQAIVGEWERRREAS